MNIECYGKNFIHKPREFCLKRRFENHFISFFLTDYVYEKNGKLIHGKHGDMIILPANEIIYHGPAPEMTIGFCNDWLYVKGNDFLEEIKRLELPIGRPFSVGGERHLAQFIEDVERERAFLEDEHEEMIELLLRQLLIKIFRAHKKNNKNDYHSKITELRQKIILESNTNWTLSKMANQCGYSTSRFSTLYKSIYGLSPMSDLLNIRIEKSKPLLLYSSRSISDIAFSTGFSSVFYFSRYFKKQVGTSPREYRQNSIKKQLK